MSVTINYLGHSSFRIKGDKAVVITDPFNISTGFHFKKQTSDIVTISHNHVDHANKEGIENSDCFFIEGSGEYEVKDVMIHGFSSFHDDKQGEERGKNVIYRIIMDDLSFCHLGDLGTGKIDEKVLKEIEGCNVLFIPVGGKYTIDAVAAKELVQKIEPNYVIPMHFKTLGISVDFEDLAGVDTFLNEMGMEVTPVAKLVVSDVSLPDETEVVVLERKK